MNDRGEEYNPFAAPRSDLAPEEFAGEDAQEIKYASLWQRFVAIFVDGFFLLILQAILLQTVIFPIVRSIDIYGNLQSALQLMWAFFPLIVSWLYFAAQESSGVQATLGKRLVHIHLCTIDGGRVGFGRSTARYFARLAFWYVFLVLASVLPGDDFSARRGMFTFACIPFLGDHLVQPFTLRRQTLHDMIAGVVVVRRR